MGAYLGPDMKSFPKVGNSTLSQTENLKISCSLATDETLSSAEEKENQEIVQHQDTNDEDEDGDS